MSSEYTEDNNDIILHETLDKNLYMQVFLKNLCLRPSCSACPSKSGKCGSDITLADYWGIGNHHPDWDDDKGTSLVLVNTDVGSRIFSQVGSKNISTTYNEAFFGNRAIEHSAEETKYVFAFWSMFTESKMHNMDQFINKIAPSLLRRILGRVKRMVEKVIC